MKVVWMFILVLWEIPRQMIMSLMTKSSDYEKINEQKEKDLLKELCPNVEDFEKSLTDKDFE